MSSHKADQSANSKYFSLIVWPAFVSACLLEAFVFSVIDPSELHWSGFTVQPSRQAVYTMAFFCFWLISMVCSGLAWWLARQDRGIQNAGLGQCKQL
jgi:hypothetical protein